MGMLNALKMAPVVMAQAVVAMVTSLVLSTLACAQPTSRTPAAQQAQGVIAPSDLLNVGLQVAQFIDGANYQGVWLNASPAVRGTVSDSDFMRGLTSMRSGSGVPSRRSWVRLDVQPLVASASTKSLGGLFANCVFESQFGGVIRYETVSFRLDEDYQWRFAGYHLSPLANSSAKAPGVSTPSLVGGVSQNGR